MTTKHRQLLILYPPFFSLLKIYIRLNTKEGIFFIDWYSRPKSKRYN